MENESNIGWVKLPRHLIRSHLWLQSTPEQKTVMITLLTIVNYTENEWEFGGEKFICRSGQVITSLESIKSKCGKGISIQNVRTAIKRFEKLGFLTNQSTNANRLITICKWENYQNSAVSYHKGPHNQLATNPQASNNQPTTTKNENKIKNKKEQQKQKNDAVAGNFLIDYFFQDLLEDADWRTSFLKDRKSVDVYFTHQDIDLLLFHFKDLSFKKGDTRKSCKSKSSFY